MNFCGWNPLSYIWLPHVHFPCSVSWCLNSSKSHVHHISFFFMVKLNLVHPIFEIPWPFVLSVSSWLNLVFPRRPSKTLVSASAANAWRTCWIAWNGVRWTPRSCNRSWCWTHAWSNGPWCNVTLGLQWVGPHYIKGVLLFMFLCVVFCMYIHMSMCIYIYICVCVCMSVYTCIHVCVVTTIVVKWPVQIVVSQKSWLFRTTVGIIGSGSCTDPYRHGIHV